MYVVHVKSNMHKYAMWSVLARYRRGPAESESRGELAKLPHAGHNVGHSGLHSSL